MLKLIKYEWMSRWKFFLAGLVVFILLNIDLVSKIIKNDNHGVFITGILWGVMFAAVIVLIVDHIRRMYKKLFTEESQFLFTVPMSGYQILGGKIGAIILECVAIILVGGIVSFIDYRLITKISKDAVYFRLPSSLPQDYMWIAMKMVLIILLGYISFMLMVYLAMVLAKSIFSAVKYSKLLSFIIFIIIGKAVEAITSWVYGSIRGDFYMTHQNMVEFSMVSTEVLLINVCIGVILFILTGYLIDRKINL